MSFGTDQLFSGTCDAATASTLAFASAVATLRARGVTVVASAGNSASARSMAAPACVSGVIAVGAVYDSSLGPVSFPNVCTDARTAADQVTCFSNGGSALDLLAPGALIISTGRGGGISTYLGTSQASPHVAGATALLLQHDPSLSPDAIESLLKSTGAPITDPRNGITTPRINVAAALGQPQPSPPPTPTTPRQIARRPLSAHWPAPIIPAGELNSSSTCTMTAPRRASLRGSTQRMVGSTRRFALDSPTPTEAPRSSTPGSRRAAQGEL